MLRTVNKLLLHAKQHGHGHVRLVWHELVRVTVTVLLGMHHGHASGDPSHRVTCKFINLKAFYPIRLTCLSFPSLYEPGNILFEVEKER